MWCGRKGIDCQYSGEFGECHISACYNTTTEKSMNDIKREAVKEFAERLKAKSYVNDYCHEVVEIEKIDELLKEYEK